MPRSRRSAPAPWRSAPGPDGRARVASGTPWEGKVGYCRAIRVGARVLVSGTTATGPDGRIVAPRDAYVQTRQVLDNIDRALRASGSAMTSVVRLRIFVVRIVDAPAVMRALGERFRPVRPTMTLVAVRGLVDPAMRVEIEADAEDPAPARRPRRRTARAVK
jgi:enamine deaminase RidA (YjgF/YER057c/UK114 family)